MIKGHCVDQILEAAEIKEVVGDFVELKQKGTNWVGCCPFHDEKTPSFTVSPQKGIATCFGCGVSVGSIRFLEQHKNMSFPEAVRYLGDKYSITIEETEPDETRDRIVKERVILIEFNEFATNFFQKQLINGALKYASGRMSKDSLIQWRIGFAPDQYNTLATLAAIAGYSEIQMIESGLVRKSEKTGSLYDFFRNRIIFPVFDVTGKVISFTGRLIDYKKGVSKYAKYINLPETPLYNKSKVLYGLNFAIKLIAKSDQAIIVEGNTDVLRLHELGITNCAAPMGTALTIDQIKMIKRFTTQVMLIYDGDQAGIDAIHKSSKLCIRNGVTPFVALLPEGEDPDTFFKSKEQFDTWISEESHDFIEYYARELIIAAKANPQKKSAAYLETAKLLKFIDPSTQAHYIDKLVSAAKMKAKLLTDELKKFDKVKSTNDADHKLPDGVNPTEFEKWGFYDHKKQYYFNTKQGIEKISNFTMKPIFHIVSTFESKRIYELINTFNHKTLADFDMNEMTSMQAFQRHIEGLGNYLFMGTSQNFTKLKLKLYEETRTCVEIRNLGWQQEGFWAWSNGMSTEEGFTPVDENGVVTFNDVNYFIPAFSQIYAKDNLLFKDERKFIFTPREESLTEWASLFIKVFGDNAILAIAFWISAVFRDHILHLFKNFPILNLFGPKGSGKSQLAMSLSCLFGLQQTPFNIHNGTKPGLAEHIQLFKNAFAWIDEYKNNIEYDKIETLKSIFDAIGRSRMNMDKGKKKETTEVNSAAIVSGQDMPTADVALFSRTQHLSFKKSEFTDEEKDNYDLLKNMERDGLSHLTAQLVKHRKFFENNYYDYYKTVLIDLQLSLAKNVIEDRILRNFASSIAAFKVINEVVPMPFSYDDLIIIATKAIIAQNDQMANSNEIGKYWNILEALLDENTITSGWQFRIDHVTKLTTKDREIQQFPQGRSVIKLKFNSIYGLYAKECKKRGEEALRSDSLLFYLKNHKLYLGEKASCRFSISQYDENKGEKIRKDQVTTAICMDYTNLKLLNKINLEREDSDDDSSDLNGHNHPDSHTDSKVNDELKDDLPF